MREMPPWAQSGTESEVASWAADRSFGIRGTHWRHANLARLGANEVLEELARPLAWLGSGSDCSPAVADVSVWYCEYGSYKGGPGAGYDAALMVTGGWLPRSPPNRFELSRLNVPAGLTAAGFRLRLAGLFRPVASAPQSASDPSLPRT